MIGPAKGAPRLNSIQDQSGFCDYDGVVRFRLRHKPWRVVFNLRGLALSPQGLIAEIDRRDTEADVTRDDLALIFRESVEGTLQLEYRHAAVSFPVVDAVIRHVERTASGLRVEFLFTQGGDDLPLLLEAVANAARDKALH